MGSGASARGSGLVDIEVQELELRRLEAPDRGAIEVLGQDIIGKREAELGTLRQRIGMLFQSYALFDFLSVAENVAFPLEQRGGMTPDEIAARVSERLRAVGLSSRASQCPAVKSSPVWNQSSGSSRQSHHA